MAEGGVEEEINTSSFKLVCQLCDKIFQEAIPIACVHLTFCRKCFEKNGLLDDLGHDMVCTRCSVTPVRRVHNWDSKQDVLSSMYLRAKCRRGLLGVLENYDTPAVIAICQQMDGSLNIAESTSSSTPSPSGSSQLSKVGGTKPCLGSGCKTCTLVMDVPEVTGPSGRTVKVEGNFTCKSKRVIYYIHCNRCEKAYVGKTTQKLQIRMSQHRGYIQQRNATSSVADHFNLHDHTIENFKVCVIKTFPPKTGCKAMMKEEKRMMIFLGTIEPNGMNKG